MRTVVQKRHRTLPERPSSRWVRMGSHHPAHSYRRQGDSRSIIVSETDLGRDHKRVVVTKEQPHPDGARVLFWQRHCRPTAQVTHHQQFRFPGRHLYPHPNESHCGHRYCASSGASGLQAKSTTVPAHEQSEHWTGMAFSFLRHARQSTSNPVRLLAAHCIQFVLIAGLRSTV